MEPAQGTTNRKLIRLKQGLINLPNVGKDKKRVFLAWNRPYLPVRETRLQSPLLIWRGLIFVALTVLLFAAKKNTPPVVDKPFAPLEAEWTMQEVIVCTDCSYPFRNDFTSTFVWPLS